MKQWFAIYNGKKILLPLIIIGLLGLLLRLGFWQLDRAKEKRNFLANQQEMMHRDLLPLANLTADSKDLRYRRVSLEGRFDTSHQFLMDNQVRNGQVGYYVLTPFIQTSDKQVVLVNRGWVLMNKNSEQLPDISFNPPDNLKITGIINQFPTVGLVLKGADELSAGWPSRVQLINRQKVSEKLGLPILDFQVQLSADQAYGYQRDWQVSTRIPPEKHIAYAFQWFALALTLVILTLLGRRKIFKND